MQLQVILKEIRGLVIGIGKAICDALAVEGVNIFAVGRNASKLAELTGSFTGIKTGSIVADLSDLNAVKEIVPACVNSLGGINIHSSTVLVLFALAIRLKKNGSKLLTLISLLFLS